MEVVAVDCKHSSCFGKSLEPQNGVSPREHLMYFGKRRSKRKSRARSRRKKPMSTARRSNRKRRRRKRKCYSRVKGHKRLSRKSKRSRRRSTRSGLVRSHNRRRRCKSRRRPIRSGRRRSRKRSRARRFGSQVAIPRDPEAISGINNGTWGWNMVNSLYPSGLGGPLGNRVQSLPINYSLS